jgi:hypothetical protein
MLCGAAALLAISLAVRAQADPPGVEMMAVVMPQPDEVAAPPDHVMASQCMAEMRARYPAARYDFSDIAFSRSATLGDIVRIGFDPATVVADRDKGTAKVFNLACLRKQPGTPLDFHVWASRPFAPDDEIGDH